jgi:hypothetical protein
LYLASTARNLGGVFAKHSRTSGRKGEWDERSPDTLIAEPPEDGTGRPCIPAATSTTIRLTTASHRASIRSSRESAVTGLGE